VERVVRDLNPGHGNGFSCLEPPAGSYIQTLCGLHGYHPEWRVNSAGPKGYVHWRACRINGSSGPVNLRQHHLVTAGEQRDLLPIEDVIHAFRAFHAGSGMPGWLGWREQEI
jgi:hypothetical protein